MKSSNTMLHLMIIDDEVIIRESLRRFIDWASIGVEVVADAANGAEALGKLQSCVPDIILTDIRMPGLDGLALIRLLREQRLDTEVIFLSAYSEFSYAKEAIRLGAFGYITKPVDEEELLKTVQACAEKIQSEREARHILSSYETVREEKRLDALRALCQREDTAASVEAQDVLRELCGGKDRTNTRFVMSCLWYETKEQAGAAAPLARAALENAFAENAVLTPLWPDTLMILFFSDVSLVQAFLDASPFLKTPAQVTLSDPHPWTGSLVLPYAQNAALEAFCRIRQTRGIVSFASFSEAPAVYDMEHLTKQNVPDMLHSFVAARFVSGEAADLDTVKLRFIHLINGWLSDPRRVPLKTYFEGEVLSAQRAITAQDSLDRVVETAYHLFINLLSLQEEERGHVTHHLIRRALALIHEHYGDTITLPSLAAQLYVSPSYLSKLFSAEVGKPFSRYLLEYRIKKACELLQTEDLKIYSVAMLCGFSDETYFSKAFKSVTGMSPHKYRQQ